MTDTAPLEIQVASNGRIVGRYSAPEFADALLSGHLVGPESRLRQVTDTSFALGMLTGATLAGSIFAMWQLVF